MADPIIPLCAECGDQLPPRKPGPGKRRVYCSDRCRKRAERRRKAPSPSADLRPATLRPYVNPDGTLPSPPPAPRSLPPDEQLVYAIAELRMTAGLLRQLAHQVRPQLSWRAEKAAEGIMAVLDDLLPSR